MTRRGRRLGLLGVVTVVALATTASAFAAISPKLDATTQASGTTIGYSQAPGDDAPASIVFYVPAGYAALLGQPDGEEVGSVTGTAVAADLGGATLNLTGKINAALPTTTISFAGATVPLSALAVQCTGTATHGAYWVLNLSASGQTLQVPAYVDDISLNDPRSAWVNNTITICLPSPEVPAGTPGRAALGAKLISANLSLDAVFSVAPGWYLWHARVTPYNKGTQVPALASTVTAQSYDRTPQELTLNVRGSGTRVTVTGRLRSGNRGVSGATVTIQAGGQTIGTTKTTGGGHYRTTVTRPSASAQLTASAKADASPAQCQQGWFGPAIQCSSAQFPSFTAVFPAAVEE